MSKQDKILDSDIKLQITEATNKFYEQNKKLLREMMALL